MVVRFHLEDRDAPLPDVHDAGVLAGPVDDPGAGRRQVLQMDLARLVGAVLRPHRGEDAELGVGRRAAEDLEAEAELLLREPVLGDEGGSDRRLAERVDAHRPPPPATVEGTGPRAASGGGSTPRRCAADRAIDWKMPRPSVLPRI